MKKFLIKALVIVVVTAAAGSGVFGVYRLVQDRQDSPVTKTGTTERLKVAVVRIGTGTLESKAVVTGEIRAVHVVDVVAKVTGHLQRLRLGDGELIDIGTIIRADPKTKKLPVIAVIEHRALEAALQQAQAGLSVAQAARTRAEVVQADSQRDKERFRKLFEKGAATPRELDKAVAAYDRSVAELKLAQAQVAQAAAGVRQCQVRLDDATVEAPISGVVVEKFVDEGNMVGPTAPLVRIARIDPVKIVGGLSERQLRFLVPGKSEATVTVDAFPDEKFAATVHLVGQALDPVTRTVKVEIRVPNPDRRLRPHMSVRVEIVLKRTTAVPVLPDTAVLRDEQGPYVFVAHKSTAFRRRVRLGMSQGVLHEILGGLKTGQLVIVRGQRQLRDGQLVNPTQENGQ